MPKIVHGAGLFGLSRGVLRRKRCILLEAAVKSTLLRKSHPLAEPNLVREN